MIPSFFCIHSISFPPQGWTFSPAQMEMFFLNTEIMDQRIKAHYFLSSNFLDDLPNVHFEGEHALPHVSTEKNYNKLIA